MAPGKKNGRIRSVNNQVAGNIIAGGNQPMNGISGTNPDYA